MLAIITRTKEIEWHVGEPVPEVNATNVNIVQADGDELKSIEHRFRNLPFGDGAVQCWFGDHAKFIAANL